MTHYTITLNANLLWVLDCGLPDHGEDDCHKVLERLLVTVVVSQFGLPGEDVVQVCAVCQ